MNAKNLVLTELLGLLLFLGSRYPQRAIRALLQKIKPRSDAWAEANTAERRPAFKEVPSKYGFRRVDGKTENAM